VVKTFLDIESTSLHADMGMLVCAVMRKDGKDRVFFVASPKRERRTLEGLLKEIGRCDRLVTFNGRSFDLPFLMSRALVLGITDFDPIACVHVDLYEECKRLLRFDRLSLDHIARTLGLRCEGALSGREVPNAYLTYLATGDRGLRDLIVAHCVSDVDTMERLAKRLQPLLASEGCNDVG
jgi:uncharacterized protein YprB with RNaseH-like and TPR domain